MNWLRSPLLGLLPWRLVRLLRANRGQSGILVMGWYPQGLWAVAAPGWGGIVVLCDGEQVGSIRGVGRRFLSVWIPLSPGRYQLELVGFGPKAARYLLHSEEIGVLRAKVSYLAFLPPTPFPGQDTPNLRSKWRRQLLSVEDVEELRRWAIPIYAKLPKPGTQ